MERVTTSFRVNDRVRNFAVFNLSVKTAIKKSIAVSQKVRRNGYSVIHLVNRELKTNPNIPLKQKLWAYRHGYVSSAVPLYGLTPDNRHEYLSEWQSERARQINGEEALIHENKRLFYYVLWPPFSDSLPALYGYLDDGRFLGTPFSPDAYESLLDCIDRVGTVVLKPVGGALGTGVYVVERTDSGYRVNGETERGAQIKHLPQGSEDYIVTEFIEQAGYAAEIYPRAANTIRIMTMVDPDTQEPFIGALGHRFGTDESAPVDNTAQGGLTAGVDLETGRIETAVKPPKNDTLDRYDVHPGTGAAIADVEIPGWERVCDRILEMAAYLAPTTPYIGWDVLVTDDDGSIAILEANSYPDVPLQTHDPLLADERTRRFYEHYDVV